MKRRSRMRIFRPDRPTACQVEGSTTRGQGFNGWRFCDHRCCCRCSVLERRMCGDGFDIGVRRKQAGVRIGSPPEPLRQACCGYRRYPRSDSVPPDRCNSSRMPTRTTRRVSATPNKAHPGNEEIAQFGDSHAQASPSALYAGRGSASGVRRGEVKSAAPSLSRWLR